MSSTLPGSSINPSRRSEGVLQASVCAIGIARNWSWDGRTEDQRAGNRGQRPSKGGFMGFMGAARPSPPARGSGGVLQAPSVASGAEHQPQTHFGHENACSTYKFR